MYARGTAADIHILVHQQNNNTCSCKISHRLYAGAAYAVASELNEMIHSCFSFHGGWQEYACAAEYRERDLFPPTTPCPRNLFVALSKDMMTFLPGSRDEDLRSVRQPPLSEKTRSTCFMTLLSSCGLPLMHGPSSSMPSA